MKPYLIITIDTEESFDWSQPFTRDQHTVESLFNHDFYMGGFYQNYGITPISLLSYPILNDSLCQRLLKKFDAQQRYIFGTHLHSWVTPPFDEALSNFNSFSHNLPPEIEYQKLKILTEKFHQVLGRYPDHYKAGRYGISKQTYSSLDKLGYQYDFSPFARRNYQHIGGADFRKIENAPFKHQDYPDIKIFPATADYTGILKYISFGKKLLDNQLFCALKGRFFFRHFNLLNFIPLTPEGVRGQELQDLTQTMIRTGQSYFHLSYHSSSFSENGNIYVQSTKDIQKMAQRVKDYIEFFYEIGGDVTFTV